MKEVHVPESRSSYLNHCYYVFAKTVTAKCTCECMTYKCVCICVCEREFVCVCDTLCVLGSCFQMTPGRELSLDICIRDTQRHRHAHTHTYECDGLFSAWLGFCHKCLLQLLATHNDYHHTHHRRQTHRCNCMSEPLVCVCAFACVCLSLMLMMRETVSVPPKSQPLTSGETTWHVSVW